MKFIYRSVIVLIFILPIFSCKGVPTSAIDRGDILLELTQTLETSNFIFHYSAGDFVYAERSEAFHNWVVSLLGVTCPKKIDYYKYKDYDQMRRIWGKTAVAWADSGSFSIHHYALWDNHECVHLLTNLIGKPPGFFNEGIAVALSTDPYNGDLEGRWYGMSVHYWGKRFKDEGTLIPLNDLLESNDFWGYEPGITYPESGSFVRFLIDTYGLDKMKSIFQSVNYGDSKDEIKQKFQSIYGFSLDQAEAEWLLFLDNY